MVVEGEERRFSWQSLLEVGKNDLPSTGPQRPTSTASVYSQGSFRAATESRVGLPYGSWKDCDRSVTRSHRVWGSAESFPRPGIRPLAPPLCSSFFAPSLCVCNAMDTNFCLAHTMDLRAARCINQQHINLEAMCLVFFSIARPFRNVAPTMRVVDNVVAPTLKLHLFFFP
jgi:hypothetical protein